MRPASNARRISSWPNTAGRFANAARPCASVAPSSGAALTRKRLLRVRAGDRDALEQDAGHDEADRKQPARKAELRHAQDQADQDRDHDHRSDAGETHDASSEVFDLASTK